MEAPQKKKTTKQKVAGVVSKAAFAYAGYRAVEGAFNLYNRNVHAGFDYTVPLTSYPLIMMEAFKNKLSLQDVVGLMKAMSGKNPTQAWDWA